MWSEFGGADRRREAHRLEQTDNSEDVNDKEFAKGKNDLVREIGNANSN